MPDSSNVIVTGEPEPVRKAIILVKHCAGKTMPDAAQYLRIASRTRSDNDTVVGALGR